MKNIQSFKNFFSIYEEEAKPTNDWREGLGDIAGLRKLLAKTTSGNEKIIGWRLAKEGDKPLWKATMRDRGKKDEIEIALMSTSPKFYDILNKINTDLTNSLKPITIKSTPLEKTKTEGGGAETKMVGTIIVPFKNINKAFDELKKAIEKYPDSTKTT